MAPLRENTSALLRSDLQDAIVTRVLTYIRGRALVVCQRDVMSGAPVFRGTRIPVETVVGLIRNGVPLQEIKEDFPSLPDDAIGYALIEATKVEYEQKVMVPLRICRESPAVSPSGR